MIKRQELVKHLVKHLFAHLIVEFVYLHIRLKTVALMNHCGAGFFIILKKPQCLERNHGS